MTSTSINLTSGPSETAGLLWNVTRNESARNAAERDDILANPGFGNYFTDHMVDLCWSAKGGWHRPRVSAVRTDPAGAVRGRAALRAGDLRGAQGVPTRGRLDLELPPGGERARMQRSAYRLALPELPVEHFLDALRQLVAVDGDWVPDREETSLYLRPFMFAKEAFLGVRPANKVGVLPDRQPRGRLLPERRGAGVDLAVGPLVARGQGRHGSGEDRRQLRVEPPAAGGGVRARLRAGAVPRLGRGHVHRGARRHERRAASTRTARWSRPSRTASSRASRSTRCCSSRATGATRWSVAG